MKPKIFTATVRWILVLPTMLVTFFIWLSAVNQPSGLWAFVCLIIAFLAGIMVAPLHGKRFLTIVASLFILSCLFPPWRATNGDRHPMGYGPVFNPPQETIDGGMFTSHFSAQIDFGRLFLEWASLAAVTGMVWVIVVKPTWSRDDKANRPQKIQPPTGNLEN